MKLNTWISTIGGALLLTCMVLPWTTASGQGVNLSVDEYQRLKADGNLPAEFHVAYSTLPPAAVKAGVGKKPAKGGQPKGGGGEVNGDCDCWIAPDDTYTLAMSPNDDQSSSHHPAVHLQPVWRPEQYLLHQQQRQHLLWCALFHLLGRRLPINELRDGGGLLG